jgi:salicylate hydroxylase
MLPFGAQDANQAIEDAGALGALFTSNTTASDVTARLALFEDVRRLRASRVQTMSRIRLGKEKEVETQVRRYTEPGCSGKSS